MRQTSMRRWAILGVVLLIVLLSLDPASALDCIRSPFGGDVPVCLTP